MYQIVGLRTLLTIFAWTAFVLAVIVAGMSILITVPTGWGWVRFTLTAVSTGVAVAAFLFGVVGQTRLFRWFCRHRLSCGVFPDLDGEWTGQLRSNWSRIEARHAGDVASIPLLARPATIRIKATLFAVVMSLDTDDRYSRSRTVLAGVGKDAATDRFSLTYVFANDTLDPKPGDDVFHLGAATLTLERRGDDLVLTGPYWTNRAWHRGLNTAGTAEFTKAR